MKSLELAVAAFCVCAMLVVSLPASYGALVRLDNVGTSTGDNLDDISSVLTTVSVVEVPGLNLTVTAIAGDGTGSHLNSTATSLGINAGDSGDDTDAFDASFNESTTWRFDMQVSITQLDFTNFESGDVFSFAGNTINNGDLSNGTTDVFDFSTPLIIAANTTFTLTATTGTIGIEAITLTAVPEPSACLFGGLVCALVGISQFRRKAARRARG